MTDRPTITDTLTAADDLAASCPQCAPVLAELATLVRGLTASHRRLTEGVERWTDDLANHLPAYPEPEQQAPVIDLRYRLP